ALVLDPTDEKPRGVRTEIDGGDDHLRGTAAATPPNRWSGSSIASRSTASRARERRKRPRLSWTSAVPSSAAAILPATSSAFAVKSSSPLTILPPTSLPARQAFSECRTSSVRDAIPAATTRISAAQIAQSHIQTSVTRVLQSGPRRAL